MSWDAKKIKEVRRALGWSVAELSRRLSCTVDIVQRWESGELEIDPEMCAQLEKMKSIIDLNNHSVVKGPKAEQVMKEKGVDQIHYFEVDDNELD